MDSDPPPPLGRGPKHPRTGVLGKPCGDMPFPEVPLRFYNLLVRAGFQSREEVENTPDFEMLRVYEIGRGNLALIRRYYPWSGAMENTMICPCCGGSGRVLRFEPDKVLERVERRTKLRTDKGVTKR